MILIGRCSCEGESGTPLKRSRQSTVGLGEKCQRGQGRHVKSGLSGLGSQLPSPVGSRGFLRLRIAAGNGGLEAQDHRSRVSALPLEKNSNSGGLSALWVFWGETTKFLRPLGKAMFRTRQTTWRVYEHSCCSLPCFIQAAVGCAVPLFEGKRLDAALQDSGSSENRCFPSQLQRC